MGTSYQGRIHNGVVVFDPPALLPEGTLVRVEPVNGDGSGVAQAPQASRFQPVGAWDGPPDEFDRLLQDVQAAREADADLERDAWT
jgi:hypothetical protein